MTTTHHEALRHTVTALTEGTIHATRTPHGGVALVRTRPLLEQLREEIHPSGQRRTTTTKTGGSGAPIALDALDVLRHIENESIHAYWLIRETTRRPGLGGYTLEQRIAYTADRAIDLDRAGEICNGWTTWPRLINDVIDPPKEVPLFGHACPTCYQDRTHVQVDDTPGPAHFAWAPALKVRFGEPITCRCGECGATWVGAELTDLGRALGLDTQKIEQLLATTAFEPLS